MSDVFWQTLFQAIVAIVVGVAGIYFNRKINVIGKNAEAAHELGNSGKGVLLKSLAAALRAVALQTKNPTDIAEAQRAEQDYADHVTAQARVDATADNPARVPPY